MAPHKSEATDEEYALFSMHCLGQQTSSSLTGECVSGDEASQHHTALSGDRDDAACGYDYLDLKSAQSA